MNKYYEAINKRINDHNKIVDDIAIRYYTYYHPFLVLYTNENFNNNLYPDVRLGVREAVLILIIVLSRNLENF